MFTTLDVLMFDTSIGEATFIKNGAMPSYIYRNNELIPIMPDTLPIGIVDELQVYKKTIPLEEEDYIIMCSDGFDEGFDDVAKRILNQYASQIPQIIGDEILREMLERSLVDDDATIIVLKMRKI